MYIAGENLNSSAAIYVICVVALAATSNCAVYLVLVFLISFSGGSLRNAQLLRVHLQFSPRETQLIGVHLQKYFSSTANTRFQFNVGDDKQTSGKSFKWPPYQSGLIAMDTACASSITSIGAFGMTIVGVPPFCLKKRRTTKIRLCGEVIKSLAAPLFLQSYQEYQVDWQMK